jgi:hypothetical protein
LKLLCLQPEAVSAASVMQALAPLERVVPEQAAWVRPEAVELRQGLVGFRPQTGCRGFEFSSDPHWEPTEASPSSRLERMTATVIPVVAAAAVVADLRADSDPAGRASDLLAGDREADSASLEPERELEQEPLSRS